MRFPLSFLAFMWLIALGLSGAKAAGVAAIKEQEFHQDSSARAIAYSRIIDSHGPYLRIVSGRVNIDILRSNLAGHVEIPDGIPSTILDEEDIAPLRGALVVMRAFISRFPRSAPILASRTVALGAHVGRFDAGDVRFEDAWLSKGALVGLIENRKREHAAANLTDIERSIFAAAQRDRGLELHDGQWMTREEVAKISPAARTEISEAIEPLRNGNLDGAKFAVQNLGEIAARQTGAAKVRTERLQTAVRNLFLAEAQLSRQLIASTADSGAAAVHEKNAENWLKPNGFGTVYPEVAAESRKKALKIRQRSADELEARRKELLDQLRETDGVAADFHHLKEQRVVQILGIAARTVAARYFKNAEFQPVVL